MTLTLFYDGQCPLCQKEMSHLRKLNRDGHLRFEDIMAPDFVQRFPNMDWHALNNRIHGMTDTGELITGLDVTHLAWSLVGKGWLYAPLRWPVIRWFADHAYHIFAKHRYTISYWLTGQKRCSTCGPNPEGKV
jgi:predicted DCC family thiol-disulfide oxidoreductase YuxK